MNDWNDDKVFAVWSILPISKTATIPIYRCSCCGKKYVFVRDKNLPDECPNCGTIMINTKQ